MSEDRPQPDTIVYPLLGSELDGWFVRFSGSGLGNCFYNYFHAVVLAEEARAKVVTPPWLSVRIGPLLRGASSKRFYWRMFRPFPGEIYGVRKFVVLSARLLRRKKVVIDGVRTSRIYPGSLNLVSCQKFTFNGLQSHRELIRRRLLGIVNDEVPADHTWGRSPYAAVHVRLDDFAQLADPTVLVTSSKTNARIPLSWYVEVVKALRLRRPELQILIFSDGKDSELAALTDMGAKLYRSGSDITDLLAMAGASVLVGSNSTYSRWAAFLGNMPSIWIKKVVADEVPSSADVSVTYLALDCTAAEL